MIANRLGGISVRQKKNDRKRTPVQEGFELITRYADHVPPPPPHHNHSKLAIAGVRANVTGIGVGQVAHGLEGGGGGGLRSGGSHGKGVGSGSPWAG